MPDLDKPENAAVIDDGADAGAVGGGAGRPAADAVLVYMTFPDAPAATAAGEALVERRLAACVNIIPGMISIYRWQGAIQRDGEVVMIAKTRRDLAAAAMAVVRAAHPYENPAMLVVPVTGGSPPFLDWIAAETAPPAGET